MSFLSRLVDWLLVEVDVYSGNHCCVESGCGVVAARDGMSCATAGFSGQAAAGVGRLQAKDEERRFIGAFGIQQSPTRCYSNGIPPRSATFFHHLFRGW
jgi:hypothetical protein